MAIPSAAAREASDRSLSPAKEPWRSRFRPALALKVLSWLADIAMDGIDHFLVAKL